MPAVDAIANRLADAMVAEDRHAQFQAVDSRSSLLRAVVVFAEGALHLEMIAPAAQLEALIAPFGELPGQFFQRRSVHPPLKRITGRAMGVT